MDFSRRSFLNGALATTTLTSIYPMSEIIPFSRKGEGTRNFPNWLKAYRGFSSNTEAPDIFHYWTGVATIAGALRRKVWIDMGHFKWYPNFFIFFVAPPGIVQKSSTVDIGMELLRELPYIHMGPAATSWQALVKKMSEIQEDVAYPDGSFVPMSAITVAARELGTFLDPRDRGMIDALVSLWDGGEGPWTKLTKQDGEEIIINPWIHIIGGCTPAWIAENLTEYFSGGGFASRTIFVYAEYKMKLVAYPQFEMPEDSDDVKKRLVEDLEQISSLVGAFKLTDEAIVWGKANYKEHYTSKHTHLQGERFGGYLARKQGHIHKLAMVISASRRSDLVITSDDLREAYEEVTRLEDDMPKVYGSAGKEQKMVFAEEMLGVILTSGGIGKEVLYRKYFKIMSHDTYEELIKSIVHTGRITYKNIGGVNTLVPTEEN